MYLFTVILTGTGILVISIVLNRILGVQLRYGAAGLLLVIMPHALGIVRPFDSHTFAVTLILAVIGVFLLALDIAKQKSP